MIIQSKMLVIRHHLAQNPAPVVAQKAQPSGGLVKIWPGEIARPFFLRTMKSPMPSRPGSMFAGEAAHRPAAGCRYACRNVRRPARDLRAPRLIIRPIARLLRTEFI